MPRRSQIQNIAALEEGMASLDRSLKAVSERLRQGLKAAWSRQKQELSARRRLVEQAVVVLLLHDPDRCWLPAFMRKHGMRDVDEELSAFDEEVVNHFLALSLEDMNAMRAPTDQRGQDQAQGCAGLHNGASTASVGDHTQRKALHGPYSR